MGDLAMQWASRTFYRERGLIMRTLAINVGGTARGRGGTGYFEPQATMRKALETLRGRLDGFRISFR